MINPKELAVQVAATQAFIDADYEMIQIQGQEQRIDDGAGGWTTIPAAPSDPIKVRLIPQSDKVAVVTPEGTRNAPDFVILGLPDTSFDRGDIFDWKGKTWIIEEVHLKPEYERKGDVRVHHG